MTTVHESISDSWTVFCTPVVQAVKKRTLDRTLSRSFLDLHNKEAVMNVGRLTRALLNLIVLTSSAAKGGVRHHASHTLMARKERGSYSPQRERARTRALT